VFSQAALHSFGSFSSVSTSDEHLEEVIAVLAKEADAGIPRVTGPVAPGKTRRDTTDSDADISLVTTGEKMMEEVAEGASLAERAVEETKDYLLRQWSRTGLLFEQVVAAVFRAMGYTATVQQGTHDLGVDVVAHPDPLGVQPPFLKIQCKSGTGTIGAPTVKQLRGLLNGPEKGVIVSLGGFSNDARHVQQNDADLVLIDGDRFVELFLEHYDRLGAEWRHKFPLTRVYVSTA
jgi:restriction system protein